MKYAATCSLAPLDIGFDPRDENITVLLRPLRWQQVKFVDQQGKSQWAKGSANEVARRLRAAGFTVEIDRMLRL